MPISRYTGLRCAAPVNSLLTGNLENRGLSPISSVLQRK